MAGHAKEKGVTLLNNQYAIDMLQPGDVLVVDMYGKKEGGTLVGDNLFYYVYKATKGGGLVIDGSVRDLEGIAEIPMPAYVRSVHPTAIGGVALSGINVPIRIGNVTVMPGDLVVGDREGVILHPAVNGRADSGPRRRAAHPRRVDQKEVRRRQVQVQRDLRFAEGSGIEERV